MKKYKEIETETPETFKRMTGLSKANFKDLSDKTDTYIKEEKKRNPLKQRGLKKSKLSLEDCLLLTIYYLRHYPTFINLAEVFDISESYCYKIYSRYVKILAQVETLPNRKKLLENPPETLIIDVTEQPIERPVKGQKPYYSGKKKDIPLRFKYLFQPSEKFYRLTALKDRNMTLRSLKKVMF